MKHVAQACLLIGMLLVSLPVLAQSGQITGVATDQHGAVIANAEVLLVNVGTSAKAEAKTNEAGTYVVKQLEPGRYRVTIHAAGFSPSSEEVVLEEGQSTTLNVVFSVASVQSSVTVRSSSPAVANDYRVAAVSTVGPFDGMEVQDTPYTITTIPQELIDNVQGMSGNDAFRTDPFVQTSYDTARGGIGGYSIRGIGITNGYKSIDGISAMFNEEAIEDKSRVEVLNGLSGFLYGIGSPGGFINYIMKRPTPTRYGSIILGSNDSNSAYAHLDFGGPLDKAGRFGYRLNVVGQNGPTQVSNQHLRRTLFSGAFDWHISKNILLQVDGSHATYYATGTTPYWSLPNASVALPKPLYPSDLWGSQPWSMANVTTGRVGDKLTWNINRIFTLRVATQWLEMKLTDIFVNDTFNPDGSGTFQELIYSRTPEKQTNAGGYVFIDGKFKTGLLSHKATIGWNEHGYELRDTSTLASLIINNKNYFSYTGVNFIAEPTLPNVVYPMRETGRTNDKNAILGDEIEVGRYATVVGGVTNAAVLAKNYNVASGAVTSHYNGHAWSPSVAVTFRMIPKVRPYFSYQQGLEQGAIAPASGGGKTVSNSGQTLAPGRDTQYELGAKSTIGRALFTADIFDLNKTSVLYTPDSNGTTVTASETGRQQYRGVEVNLTGKLFDSLTIVSGFTAVQARYRVATPPPAKPAGYTVLGTWPGGVPEIMGKIYAEYAVAGVRGLIVNGSLMSTGQIPEYDTQYNASGVPVLPYKTPSYVVADLGLRYTWPIVKLPLTFRAYVKNLTNNAYWDGAYNAATGQARTLSFSAQYAF
jgi:iron complex outermembrane receptor protein